MDEILEMVQLSEFKDTDINHYIAYENGEIFMSYHNPELCDDENHMIYLTIDDVINIKNKLDKFINEYNNIKQI